MHLPKNYILWGVQRKKVYIALNIFSQTKKKKNTQQSPEFPMGPTKLINTPTGNNHKHNHRL